MKSLRFLFTALSVILLLASLTACGSGSGSGSNSTGTLSLSLIDATTTEHKAVYVTIKEIQVHRDDGSKWQVVATPNKTYNLLELVNGVREQLGLSELQTGFYTQMRLFIGVTANAGINILSESHPYANYFVDSLDHYQELNIPSGPQTGIKIHGFFINENETTELILDFDASKSIIQAGGSGQWHLKPTIKVLDTENYSIINGSVDTVEGVLVSAQMYDSAASDVKDEVLVQTATITDVGGPYKIFLEPNTYNVIAYKKEYSPACKSIATDPDTIKIVNFTLSSALTGNIIGNVAISGGDSVDHVTVSFRQSVSCQDVSTDQQIEVTSLNVAKDGDYSVNLPVGIYSVVASTYGRSTQEEMVNVIASTNTTHNLTF